MLKKVFSTLIFFIITLIILVWSVTPIKYDLKVGSISRVSINAPREVLNEYQTNKKKNEIKEAFIEKNKIYKKNDYVYRDGIQNLENFFNDVNSVRNNKKINDTEKLKTLRSKTGYIKLTDDQYKICLIVYPEELKKLQNYTQHIFSDVMDEGIERSQINDAISKVKNKLQDKNISQSLKNIGCDMISYILKPNLFYDRAATITKADEEANKVQPVMIKEGQKILDEGQVVNKEQITVLKTLGVLKNGSKLDYGTILTFILLLLSMYALAYAYIVRFKKNILLRLKQTFLIQIIFVLNLLIAAAINQINAYLIPTAIAGVLIALMIDTRLGILINVFSTILISMMMRGTVNSSSISFNYIYISLLVGTIGCIAVSSAKHRSAIFGVGLLMGVVNMVLIVIFEHLSGTKMDVNILLKAIMGFLNGIITIVLSIGSLPLWEIVFDILTPFKLLELSNPDQPIIKRMLMEAPGTYHHSLIVGNLAEAAIQEIGGNPLLARVGAYYHDIGKINRPYFFKENQFGDNPHEKLTPNLSTLVIISHVKDGIEIARQHKLPEQIIDFIRQHHGDTLVAYFYHKALQIDSEVKEESFRYAGPVPQTKEVAAVMLADSVEAAVRALKDPTRGKVEGLIRKIIKDKLDDGQLEECPLTLKDLDKIAKTYLRVLSGVFHERIEYPNLDLDKLKQKENKQNEIEDPIEEEIKIMDKSRQRYRIVEYKNTLTKKIRRKSK